MTGWAADLLLGCAVLVGCTVQRALGVGFALAAVPALVLLVGPDTGVLLSNCASGLISAVGLAAGWRRVRPREVLPLVATACLLVPVGAWVAHRLAEPALLLGIGALVCLAVVMVAAGPGWLAPRGLGGALGAGAASGFMNAAAGVGGPAVTLYGLGSGWTMAEFVPNAQVYGLVVNALSVAVKGAPRLPAAGWAAAGGALVGGAVLGRLLGAVIPERAGRRLVLLLALLGGLTALVKGALAW